MGDTVSKQPSPSATPSAALSIISHPSEPPSRQASIRSSRSVITPVPSRQASIRSSRSVTPVPSRQVSIRSIRSVTPVPSRQPSIRSSNGATTLTRATPSIHIEMDNKDSDAKPGLEVTTDGAKLQDIKTTVESDIYDMGPQLKVEYDDVFVAPDDYNIFTSITDINRKIFNKTQVVVYSIFSIILGVILSFLWAIIFGLLNVISIYVLQPSSKVFFILLRVAGMIFKALIGSFCDPFYRSLALVFSRINVAALTATEAKPVGMRIYNSNLQIV